jgi:hypothetical protein
MSVCPYDHMEQLGYRWIDFDEILYLSSFLKPVKNSSFIKIWQEWRVLYMKTYVYLIQYLAESFLKSEIFPINL